MKHIILLALIILFIVLVIIFPFKARGQLYINLFNGLCIYSIKILFIKNLLGRTKLSLNGGLQVENAANLLKIDSKNAKVDQLFAMNLTKKVKVAKLDVITKIGIFNPYFTAMACGSTLSIISIINSMVLNNNPFARVFTAIDPKYNSTSFEITAQTSLEISILSIIIALIKAKKEFRNVQKS